MEAIDKIKEMAEKYGLNEDYFFITTLERYEEQLKILAELKATLDKAGVLVTKEYVKGRENVCSHPAIQDYNRTADSANKTASALLKMIEKAKKEVVKTEKPKDPLADILGA